jgi:hypothetical protein
LKAELEVEVKVLTHFYESLDQTVFWLYRGPVQHEALFPDRYVFIIKHLCVCNVSPNLGGESSIVRRTAQFDAEPHFCNVNDDHFEAAY